MKNRKVKSTKAGSNRRKVPSDVSPSTSLPPLVEGQLRCFLRVTVSRILWTIPKPPAETFVRLRWWGESSNGTHFRPRNGSQTSQTTVKSTARFPIRCGPKQFTSYMTDMGSLVLEVVTKPDHLPIARSQVTGISQLSLSHAISGFYTLVSPTSEKLGELQVSIALEPLTESYDSSSSVPTTDMSIEKAVNGLTAREAQHHTLVVPSLSRPLSASTGKGSVGSCSVNTPRGRDHLFFQSAQGDRRTDVSLENQNPTSARSQQGHRDGNPTVLEPHNNQTSNDILSVLLERGSKLRNAMVVSALKTDLDSDMALKDTPLPLPKDNVISPRMPSLQPCGNLLQNILHTDSSLLQSAPLPVSPDCLISDRAHADSENKAVDLLLGSLDGSSLPLWDGEGSPPASLSGHSSVCGDSELNDPQYDHSLLENLFYKALCPDSFLRESPGDPSLRRSQGPLGGAEERPPCPRTTTGLDSEPEQRPGTSDPGLSMDQLTVLGGIRLARVVIHSLTVPIDSTTVTPKKSKGKPPRPPTNKKCSYFVEYLFPVTPTRHEHSQQMAAEVNRLVSNKVSGGVVKFEQRSVFPVQFNGATVERWWETDLTFNIYSRKISQKKPEPVGTAVFPLRRLLQSDKLNQTVVLPVQSLGGPAHAREIGPLKVSLELAADSKDFSSAKIRSAASSRAPPAVIPSPQRVPSPSKTDTTARPQGADTGRWEDGCQGPRGDSRIGVRTVQLASSLGPSPLPSLQTSPSRPGFQQFEEDYEVLLHALLMVPDGKDFNCGPLQVPNIYLNCKLFGSDETTRSVMSWGQTNPSFNLSQVTPVALTSRLLDRMRNNVMVIEVWQRAASSGQERLLGLVKLPLHQFYMSFRDPKISHLLLQAQYPVLGVDSYMPVIDVFSGSCKGNLRVLLAMGSSGQIIALQRTRDEEHVSVFNIPRPAHLLDHHRQTEATVKAAPVKAMREHVFVVRVEKVNGLAPLQSTVWGEADCYVQYSFPSQEEDTAQILEPDVIESSVSLKQFRTSTTLCVPDPVFGHSETHVLLSPEAVPVQRLLLGSFSSQLPAHRGGIQFEVWCRYYYPNVRDQMVARGMLPLSKLCAMVTMQMQKPAEAQLFSLPLVPRTSHPAGHQPQPSGLLDVCVQYEHRPLRSGDQRSGAVASRIVTMVVKVHRASGLKAAARAVTERDEAFQYYADVGVNAYVTTQLSFLPEGERRSTRVVARTFCPEFDHHSEFPCLLQVLRSSGESGSLAEILHEASAEISIWNRDSRRVTVMGSPKSNDTLLGTVRIQLADMIHKRTGICGWFGLSLPQDQGPFPAHHILVGGLEISINFAHHADRERVITAAQGLGWEVGMTGEKEDQEADSDGEAWVENRRTVHLTLAMPRAWLPVHSLLLPGHSELQRSTYCYFRYKLYDREAFCSLLRHPCVEDEAEDGLASVAFPGGSSLELKSSLPLVWYLREERLEVQVWVAFGKERTSRPHDTDRLVGSAFVDLSSFAKKSRHKLTISGVYPLFRRSAPDLSGAALRVHVTLTPGPVPLNPPPAGADLEDSDSQGVHSPAEEVEGEGHLPAVVSGHSGPHSGHQPKSSVSAGLPVSERTDASMDDAFSVSVTVDRAMRLSLKGCPLAEGSGAKPCCCVSYVTADSAQPITTELIADSDCPVWGHQLECRLSKQLLVDPQESLVFKVWHRGDLERVIGFASVDLSPLLSGFQSVCGWYNITDFSGQCQGQLKVSISPLKGVQDLKGQRQALNEDVSKDSSALFRALPLYYHTAASYSSFPSHISRYPEQRVISSPDRLDQLRPERFSEGDRHNEHMDNVRLYHQSLQEGAAAQSTGAAADSHPSSSMLFSALRKNLSELDDMQRYFNHKLSTPTFPSRSERGRLSSRLEEHRDSETDTRQLLLKSSRLVGEVNSLVSGLQSSHMETALSVPQCFPATPPVPDDQSFTSEPFPNGLPCLRKTTHSPLVEESPLPSPPPGPSEQHSESQGEDQEEEDYNLQKAPSSEDESDDDDDDGGGCGQEMGEEDEEDGDYEETVVEPRPLNEVTSLTDRTSPWTSLLSDPDLGSLESLEAPEEQPSRDRASQHSDLSPEGEGGVGTQMTTLQSWGSGGSQAAIVKDGERFHSDRSDGSETDDSDTERGGARAHQAPDEIGPLEPQDSGAAPLSVPSVCSEDTPNRARGDRGGSSEDEDHTMSLNPEYTTRTSDTRSVRSPEEGDGKLQHTDPVEIPNFFLPPHHLEASMRALRLAPAFPKDSLVQQGIPYRRAPRPRPSIPPSSMKKEETKRIAKIFAAHFSEKH
ncbi:C2 domain-containing protein 3 [Osmerus mordax]|uniref:C2 domain-containing protein 3 n=1 Tax=Osmerus mordax TaxID=8014 RepID=UPI00350FE785